MSVPTIRFRAGRWLVLLSFLAGAVPFMPEPLFSADKRGGIADGRPVPGSAGPVQWDDPWLARDKAQHFLASMLITGSVSWMARYRADRDRDTALAWGVGVSLSLGLAKEWRDHSRPRNRFSWKDLTADILGILAGGWLLASW